MRSTPKLAALAAAIAVAGWNSPSSAAQPQSFSVDCSKGQTVAAALDRGDERKAMILTVQGTCNENVLITRDDVTLQGDASKGAVINGASASPTITVRANSVTLNRLTVRGGSQGISLAGANNVGITNSDVQFAASQGINIVGSSAVSVVGSSVQNNTRSGITAVQSNVAITQTQVSNNAGDGVRAFRGSSVSVTGSTVSSNVFGGVNIQSSEATIDGSTIAGNGTDPSLAANLRLGVSGLGSNVNVLNSFVRDNSGGGVWLSASGYLNVGNSTVTANTGEGVLLYLGATGNIFGNTSITGNAGDLALRVNSVMQLGSGNLTIPNIFVVQGSTVQVNPDSGPPINGSVFCADGESSINPSPRFTGPVSCTGF